jgi:F0F1-type ATP synthase assembly protein I
MSESVSDDETVLSVEPKQADKSLGELFGDLGREIGGLVRAEFQLAKTESRQEIRTAAQTGISFGAAAVAGLVALILLSHSLAWLLDQWMNTALAYLVVGLIWTVVAAVAITVARARMRQIEPLPQTVETIKEDVEWVKQQKR